MLGFFYVVKICALKPNFQPIKKLYACKSNFQASLRIIGSAVLNYKQILSHQKFVK